MKRILFFISLISIMPFPSYAVETINAVYVDGIAPIAIDGDLSDWAFTNMPFITITGVNPQSKPGRPRDAADLSAEFQCLADQENLYVAVKVTDDNLVFGKAPVGRPYDDDCVELLFYGDFNENTPLKIWVSADKYGKVKLEGREPLFKMTYPYLLQNKGIFANIKNTSNGYNIEVAIPKKVFNIQIVNNQFQMNVLVYDHDFENIESIVQWKNIIENEYGIIKHNNIISQLPNQPNINININIIDHKDNIDIDSMIQVALAYNRAEMYNESNNILNKLLKNATNIKSICDIKSLLIINYYYLAQYNIAKDIGFQMISDNIEISDIAKSILKSIDLKQYENQNDIFPSDLVNNYNRVLFMELYWGSRNEQIGYLSEVYGGIHGGVPAFDIDKEENVYILDAGNKCVKMFNRKGDFVRIYPITARFYGSMNMCIDDSNNIWTHEATQNIFRVYNHDGKLFKSIEYNTPLSATFEIRKGFIYGYNSVVNIKAKTNNYGINNETVYSAEVEKRKEDLPSSYNSGRFSNRIYLFNDNEYDPKVGLTPVSFTIYENSFKHLIILNELNPNYQLLFKGEDKYGNYYFLAYTIAGKFKQHILKYNSNNRLVAIIPNIELTTEYVINKPIVVDDNGNIYIIKCNDNRISIEKYIKL